MKQTQIKLTARTVFVFRKNQKSLTPFVTDPATATFTMTLTGTGSNNR